MSNLSQAEFLFAVLPHTTKGKARHIAEALNLTVGAYNMRMTRLKRGYAARGSEILKFLLKVMEFSRGKTDLKGLATELGMKTGAVHMRLSTLRKGFGQHAGAGAGCVSQVEDETRMDEVAHMKQEIMEVKFDEGLLNGPKHV